MFVSKALTKKILVFFSLFKFFNASAAQQNTIVVAYKALHFWRVTSWGSDRYFFKHSIGMSKHYKGFIKKGQLMEQYQQTGDFSIYSLDFDKKETSFGSAQEIVNRLKILIDDNKVSRFIGEFDHYSHTKGLDGGVMDEDIIDARNILFCFGKTLSKASLLAVRPRSIGVAEKVNGFTVSFVKMPMALADETIEKWIKSLLQPF